MWCSTLPRCLSLLLCKLAILVPGPSNFNLKERPFSNRWNMPLLPRHWCASESPASPVRTPCWPPAPEFLSQVVWDRASELSFPLLVSTQVMLTLLVQAPHSEGHGNKQSRSSGAYPSREAVAVLDSPDDLGASKQQRAECLKIF